MLEVKGLVAGYAGSEVLHGIDLVVDKGEGVVVLGPNGHGKTTLLRAITGLLPPRAGQVLWNGTDITRWRADVIAAAGVVHIPQGDLLFPEMTVTENLLMGAYHRPTWAERKDRLERVYEPSLGLAPLTTEQIYASIHKVKESGIALLLADENANHVAGLADRVYLLETGSLVREGPADTLLKDQALLESYLG